ncbi:MAG: hypothetical protein U0934_03380 [Pseudotabrizicola sp.]|uniref:hypothetical protein n=1 Tax=Pseudotabrizicola sp. TaxID=2939647 RepID=UPI00272505EE|nr:hypothetical protein [Pseudotabrizicola sp.]MDO8884418.1 hypothetical protein [Pseudotabrizicola sp.]MDP2081471.1 hypothetical protein [Pseudotabrizicola sp.]MDZ7572984.1 hypothetical protein [Pseudotabrizicola sp.]
MPKTILVQDPDGLISLDLAQTVMEAWPDASVILCRDVMQAVATLSDGQRPELLVLRQSLRKMQAFALVDLICDLEIKVLLTAADDDEGPDIAELGWHALDMPFSAAQVREALHDACPETQPCMDSYCKEILLG